MEHCPKCQKHTKNRAGMSSHIKTNHPELFAEWSKDSIKSGSATKAERLREANRLASEIAVMESKNGLHQGTDFKPTKRTYKKRAQAHRDYQRNWYRQNKSVAAREKKQADLPVSNMHVSICPRCHCRFGTMIIEG